MEVALPLDFDSRDGIRRAHVQGALSDDDLAMLRGSAGEIEEVTVSSPFESVFDELARLPNLRDLFVFSRDSDVSFRVIEQFSNLERLGLDIGSDYAFDGSAFPNLVHLGLVWPKRYRNLAAMNHLTSLIVRKIKPKDAPRLCEMPYVETLGIYGSPLKDIEFLECFSSLRSLALINLRTLTSIEGLRALAQLRVLRIDTCRKISSIEPIRNLGLLEDLQLDNMGDIPSLTPVLHLSALKQLSFTESTNILDGRIRMLLDMNLTSLRYQNRTHYDYRYNHLEGFRSEI